MHRNNLFYVLACVTLLIGFVSCDPSDIPGESLGTSIIEDTTTAAGTYTINGNLTVDAVWTIEPGTIINIAPDCGIDVSSTGRIVAVGTSDSTITFRSGNTVPAKGDWYGIADEGNGSRYEYCVISHADTGLYLDGSAVSVKNTAFSANTVGLDFHSASSLAALSSNSFTGNIDPLIINGTIDLDDTNAFTSNTHQYVTCSEGAVQADRSWALVQIPIYAQYGMSIASTLTLAPGVVITVGSDRDIDLSDTGKIVAVGRSDAKITFKSGKSVPAKGDWYGIADEGNGSRYEYCVISHADTGLYLDGSAVSVKNTTFSANTVGLDFHLVSSLTALSSNSFTGNIDPLIINGTIDLDDTNTFTSNTHQYVTCSEGVIEADRSWALVQVPIYAQYGMSINAALTLSPGVEITVGADRGIDIGTEGTLSAVGSSDAYISFISGITTPAAGDWYGITIDGNGCVMDYCVVRHADTGITINSADFNLTNSTLESNTVNYDSSGASGWTAGTGNTFN